MNGKGNIKGHAVTSILKQWLSFCKNSSFNHQFEINLLCHFNLQRFIFQDSQKVHLVQKWCENTKIKKSNYFIQIEIINWNSSGPWLSTKGINRDFTCLGIIVIMRIKRNQK